MADYICWVRTNYFKVKDENALRELLDQCTANDKIELHSSGKGVEKQFCFTCDGRIYGLENREGNKEDFDGFILELQKLLPSHEAILLQEVGHEKFCYLVGSVLIITETEIQYIDVKEKAVEVARKLLKKSDFTTDMDY